MNPTLKTSLQWTGIVLGGLVGIGVLVLAFMDWNLLKHPVDVGSTVKQGAIAAALGTVLTPVATVIAFVDPGLAKDQNCAAMLAAAQPPSNPKLR